MTCLTFRRADRWEWDLKDLILLLAVNEGQKSFFITLFPALKLFKVAEEKKTCCLVPDLQRIPAWLSVCTS